MKKQYKQIAKQYKNELIKKIQDKLILTKGVKIELTDLEYTNTIVFIDNGGKYIVYENIDCDQPAFDELQDVGDLRIDQLEKVLNHVKPNKQIIINLLINQLKSYSENLYVSNGDGGYFHIDTYYKP